MASVIEKRIAMLERRKSAGGRMMHFIKATDIADSERQIAEFRAQFSEVLVFVMRDDERAADRLIQIGQRLLRLVRMCEWKQELRFGEPSESPTNGAC